MEDEDVEEEEDELAKVVLKEWIDAGWRKKGKVKEEEDKDEDEDEDM